MAEIVTYIDSYYADLLESNTFSSDLDLSLPHLLIS